MKKNWIRYGLLALLVVTFGLLWIASGDLVHASTALVILVLIGAFVVAIVGDLIAEIPLWYRRLRGIPFEDYLDQLEAKGDAVRSEYHADHALTVDDFTTGRLMHFLDIGDGSILCLYGQQYYEFEPIDDDPAVNQARQFPTKTFSLVRRAKNDEVLALFPGSDVIDPVVCDPIVEPKKLLDLGFQLTDGEVVSGASLQAIEDVLKTAT